MSVDLLEIHSRDERRLEPISAPVDLRDERRRSRRTWVHACLAGAAAFVAIVLYWPTLGFDFVNWDDPWYVIENPLIRSWHPANLYRIATEVAIKNYAPLTVLSFLVDYTISGLKPAGYHLTNLLLHAVNVALVYVLIFRITRNRVVACSTALLFAVHPLQVESVAWVSSRKGLLSGAFTLASLICWLRPNRTAKCEGYGLLFYAAALLSKALAIVIPPVVLLYDVLVLRQKWSAAIARQIVPGIMAILLLLITMSAQNTEIGGMRGHMELGKLQILAVDAVIVWKYVGMLLWPRELCVLYDQPTSGIAVQMAASIVGWMAVAAVLFHYRRRCPLVVLAVASFFLFLFPVLNFFPITTLMNDRYLYLPSIPAFALLATGIQRFAGKIVRSVSQRVNRGTVRRRNVLASAAIACLAFCYANATNDYLPVWNDGMSLWQDASSKVPQLCVVQIQLANSYHAAGDNAEAIRVLNVALNECQPDELDRARIEKKLADWGGN